MKITYSILLTCSMLATAPAISAFSFTDWYHNLFGSKRHHKKISNEYPLGTQNKVRLTNTHGSISIKTNWNHKKILLTATVKDANADALNGVRILAQDRAQTFELKTIANADAADALVDWEVIIPADIALEAIAFDGDITIKQITKPAILSTENGSISIYKSQHPVAITIGSKGSITIEHAHSTVKAITAHGDITIRNAQNTVIAHTQKGSIIHHSSKVPSTARIELLADAGTITTQLPPEVNAELQAHTKKGMVTCEHSITMRPLTTTITKNTFDRFKKEIEGTLGSGEARIYLSALKGDIAIKEVKG